MNKKGFTTIELIVSFIMVVVILTSLIGFTTAYRGRVSTEEVKTQLIDYKNTILKVVYDDIVRYSVIRMAPCVGEDNCVNFIGQDGNIQSTLKTITVVNNNNPKENGVYINYKGVDYKLPDSNLNKTYVEIEHDNNGNEVYQYNVTDSACNITNFKYTNYENRIFTLKMTIKHYLIDEEFNILITIT